MNALITTGFAEIDRCIGGGFQRHTSTLIVAPTEFGKTEYAHYLLTVAERNEIVSAVVTSNPDDLLELPDAYADYVIKFEADHDAARVIAELEAVPVCPGIVVVDNVPASVLVQLAHSVRNFSTLVMFTRPFHLRSLEMEAIASSDLVLLGTTQGSHKVLTIHKNKSGLNGIGTLVTQRTKGSWEK